MTREDMLLYADYQIDPNMSDEDFDSLVTAVSSQLASLLCLKDLPDPLNSNLTILLANALAFFLNNRGISGNTESESIRSYSYKVRSDTPTMLYDYLNTKFSNLIDAESKCEGLGFRVSRRGGEYRRHGGCCGRL